MKTLRFAVLAVWAGAAPLAAAGQAPALSTFAVGGTTVTVSAVATNLDIVWELVWGPDNFLWATERYGRISRINPATGQVLPLLTLPDVTAVGESGLLGMALHPQFSTSPYVYVVYNYTDAGGLKEKVVRYTYSATANTLTAPLVLLGGITAFNTHSGSRLLILPDLTLLVTTGDASQASLAQNPASLNGKILRMNLDGTVPADNPTPNSLVYTLGHRNPQGLVRLPNGNLYSSEHGPNNDDEINKIEAGRNYGWPDVEGYCDLTAERTFCAANNVREPLYTWTPTIAPGGLAYYDHPAIPGWRGSLLLAVLKGQRLLQLPLDAAGAAITGPTDYLAGQFGRLRAICVSPAGKVYVGTSNLRGQIGNPAATDDRVLVLENRSFVSGTRAAAGFSFDVYPNPASRTATVRLPAGARLTTVRDVLGRAVITVPVGTPAVTLDLRALPAGTYLVEADGPAGRATRKLVVE
ncbi:PQQ-dependent sugar dehydrogenase [Hymenobacter sp. 5317J-9]|uniref:PQQ-dependent sugar dehydrogenase n=1 Tax=Hymenobacter sp. 5317J-9 TaxID=2932250 RepID=UPI001FD6C69E|nr:PQQ-dependent sugar dehydrogenase [Hymenobacter sp. 5317J-9]UOQ98314.1 PQQ-dependent sugar dehydrogenase [Hymenobacter sp. 5317J-9]